MTGPGSSFPPPVRRRRRRVLVGAAVAWGVAVIGLALWSVGHSPATVPEQRTVGQAMPELRQAVGVVFAAAGGPGRAVVLGELRVAPGCRVTPVRHGVSVTRDVTVYVRAGEQRADIEAIATALPARYRAEVTPSRGGTRFALHADAGNFIGIDLDATIGDSSLTLRVSSGCRPVGAGGVDRADPAAEPAPAALRATLAALGATEQLARLQAGGAPSNPAGGGEPSSRPSGETGEPASPGPAGPAGGEPASRAGPSSGADPGAGGETGMSTANGGLTVQSVRCPAGGTAGTYTVGAVAAPADWARRLGRLASGAAVVRSDTSRWAYRTGNDSVVVVSDGHRLTVSASRACG